MGEFHSHIKKLLHLIVKSYLGALKRVYLINSQQQSLLYDLKNTVVLLDSTVAALQIIFLKFIFQFLISVFYLL